MQIKVPLIALAALLAVGPAQTALAAPEYTKSCLAGIITATGKHAVHMKAKRLAREDWVDQALSYHGASFANYNNAQIITDHCANTAPRNSAPMWLCTFVAKPCRVNPTDLKPHKPFKLEIAPTN